MMASFANLVARSNENSAMSPSMLDLLIALLVLIIFALLLVVSLLFVRQRRRARRDAALKLDVEKRFSTASTSSSHSHHRRVKARPSEFYHVHQEKQSLRHNSSDPPSPANALPEIRITFPEEFDDCGKRQSGHVVVVTLSDASLGLGPVEKLPPYEAEGQRFYSVDLERVGGLVEKARNSPRGWKEMQ